MKWEDIQWGNGRKDFLTLVHSTKNQHYNKGERWIQPIHPIVEECFRKLYDSVSEKRGLIFPWMKKKHNLLEMIRKDLRKSGIEVWRLLMRNARRSFCTDLRPMISDKEVYEYITDHSSKTDSMYYQMMSSERLEKAFKQQRENMAVTYTLTSPEKTMFQPGGYIPPREIGRNAKKINRLEYIGKKDFAEIQRHGKEEIIEMEKKRVEIMPCSWNTMNEMSESIRAFP